MLICGLICSFLHEKDEKKAKFNTNPEADLINQIRIGYTGSPAGREKNTYWTVFSVFLLLLYTLLSRALSSSPCGSGDINFVTLLCQEFCSSVSVKGKAQRKYRH
jgi:hypothetical protein